jgi:hypothetical protein
MLGEKGKMIGDSVEKQPTERAIKFYAWYSTSDQYFIDQQFTECES